MSTDIPKAYGRNWKSNQAPVWQSANKINSFDKMTLWYHIPGEDSAKLVCRESESHVDWKADKSSPAWLKKNAVLRGVSDDFRQDMEELSAAYFLWADYMEPAPEKERSSYALAMTRLLQMAILHQLHLGTRGDTSTPILEINPASKQILLNYRSDPMNIQLGVPVLGQPSPSAPPERRSSSLHTPRHQDLFYPASSSLKSSRAFGMRPKKGKKAKKVKLLLHPQPQTPPLSDENDEEIGIPNTLPLGGGYATDDDDYGIDRVQMDGRKDGWQHSPNNPAAGGSMCLNPPRVNPVEGSSVTESRSESDQDGEEEQIENDLMECSESDVEQGVAEADSNVIMPCLSDDLESADDKANRHIFLFLVDWLMDQMVSMLAPPDGSDAVVLWGTIETVQWDDWAAVIKLVYRIVALKPSLYLNVAQDSTYRAVDSLQAFLLISKHLTSVGGPKKSKNELAASTGSGRDLEGTQELAEVLKTIQDVIISLNETFNTMEPWFKFYTTWQLSRDNLRCRAWALLVLQHDIRTGIVGTEAPSWQLETFREELANLLEELPKLMDTPANKMDSIRAVQKWASLATPVRPSLHAAMANSYPSPRSQCSPLL